MPEVGSTAEQSSDRTLELAEKLENMHRKLTKAMQYIRKARQQRDWYKVRCEALAIVIGKERLMREMAVTELKRREAK